MVFGAVTGRGSDWLTYCLTLNAGRYTMSWWLSRSDVRRLSGFTTAIAAGVFRRSNISRVANYGSWIVRRNCAIWPRLPGTV